jgi:hypothetical protein
MIVQTGFEGTELSLRKTRKRARVSDHALLRYLERVLDVPVEQIRRSILTDGVILGMAMGAQSVRAEDHQVVIQGRVVTTVLAPAMIVRRRRRKPKWLKVRHQAKAAD